MHTIIRSTPATRPNPALASTDAFRRPNYDCREHANALKLVIYVPGVDPAAIEVEARGPDLIVTAQKRRAAQQHAAYHDPEENGGHAGSLRHCVIPSAGKKRIFPELPTPP